MKKLILKGFEVQIVMIFFSFIVFATNEFTLSHLWINIPASVLLIFVYLMMIYSDSFKVTREYIRLGKKPPVPCVSSIAVYIIPIALLIWTAVSPLYFKEAYIIDPGDLENGISPTYDYVRAVRQTAWFELYMSPYKGIYKIFGGGVLCHILTLLPAPFASYIGYACAKRGCDLMEKASGFVRKIVYGKAEN